MINAYETSGTSSTIGQQVENQLINSLRSNLKALNVSNLVYILEDTARTIRRLSETKSTLDALSTGWWERKDGSWGSIYAIVPQDSAKHVVYVGQTTNLMLRIASHFITGDAGTFAFVNDCPVQLLILEDGVDKDNLTEREQHWMREFWNKGYSLINRKVSPHFNNERVACYGNPINSHAAINMSRVTVRSGDTDIVVPLVDPLFEFAPVMLSWLRRKTIEEKTQEAEQCGAI